MITIDSTLDDIMQLDFASREILLEVLQKRQAEERRDKIAKSAKKSLKEYHSGKLEPRSAVDTIEYLNNL